jgi:RNA recognition motif-containing protein
MNLYVGNLPFTTTEEDLTNAFSAYGTVTRAQIVIDRMTNRSRGFGFVEMTSGGSEAIEALNGADFHGRRLTVNEAKPRESRSSSRSSGYSSSRY